jgi:hypothetical protein
METRMKTSYMPASDTEHMRIKAVIAEMLANAPRRPDNSRDDGSIYSTFRKDPKPCEGVNATKYGA